MREIKFRAWLIKPELTTLKQKMYYNVGISFSDCGMSIELRRPMISDVHWCPTHPAPFFELMQWTGLKDKNGVDVYEGDIIKVYNWGILSRDQVLGVTQVIWDVDECGWRYENPLGAEDFYDQFRNVEVIGNIHENPELLGD